MSENNASRYIVAAIHEWNRRIFDEDIRALDGRWEFASDEDELDRLVAAEPGPKYLFFLHWPWKVSSRITEKFECINFHMSDVPYGRGGSPLQNLILNGHRATKMSALRMIDEFDAGPVYLKRDLDLSGRASEIYERGSRLAASMIEEIVERRPEPVAQSGEATRFRRRTPAQSRLPETTNLSELYDFIRMLDAPGYPHAFSDHGGVNIEFSDASLQDEVLTAHARLVQSADSGQSTNSGQSEEA